MADKPRVQGRLGAGAVWRALFGHLGLSQVAWRLGADLLALNAALLCGLCAWIIVRVLALPTLPAYMVGRELRHQYSVHLITYNGVALAMLLLLRVYTHLPRRTLVRVALGPLRVSAVGLLLHTSVVYLFGQRQFPMRGAVVLSWGLAFVFMAGLRWARQFVLRRYQVIPLRASAANKVEQVLVIGGAGYIGSVLVGQLLDAGYQVRVLDRLLFGEQPLRHVIDRPGLEMVHGDLRDVAMVVRAVKGVDAAVHLGAIVGDPACALDDEMTLEINYAATQMIREVCTGAGVSRFVFASTCSVYGAADALLREESELKPVSLYARSKVASEHALLENGDENFSSTVLRFATVFGLSPRMRFDLVVNLLAAQAHADRRIRIFNGDQWRPFISVHDVARAIAACLAAPQEVVGGRVFNVGDNSMNFTLSQLGEVVQRVVPETVVEQVENDEDRRNYRVQFDRIQRTLRFRCTRTLESGIREIVDAIGEGRIPDFRDPIYNNAAFLKDDARGSGFPRHGVLGAWSRDLVADEESS